MSWFYIKKNLTIFIALVLILQTGQAQATASNNLLSIDITASANSDYDSAFKLAQGLGMQVTSISITWDEFETSVNRFNPDDNYLKTANDYYPEKNTQISLMLGFIDTNNLRLPSDLMKKDLDDPELINRFKAFIDYAFEQIPDLELSSLAINNEIDAYLGTNDQLWQDYQTFYKEITDYIHNNYPSIKIGTKITYDGLAGFARAQAKLVNSYSDIIMMTYYPIKPDFTVREPVDIEADIRDVLELYPNKNLYIMETGYPSSKLLASSQKKQAEFIKAIFQVWDLYAEQIKLIDFLWLHDLPPDALAAYGEYYNVDSKRFIAFIGSLGLRSYDGKDKLAFKALLQELKARGW